MAGWSVFASRALCLRTRDRFSERGEPVVIASNPYKTVIRFDQAAEQSDGAIKRVVGFVRARSMLSLFDDATLDANPRSAKANSVVADIIGSLREDPKSFQFKTKGLLLGTSDYTELDRRRYELRFNDPASEGLLDGGHNMLAIGTHILSRVIDDDKALKAIKLWEDMKAAWHTYREAVETIKDELAFSVPVELLVPTDLDNDEVVEAFRMSLLDICAARNNNAQLTQETKANQRGFYDEIRIRLPKAIAERVEWKSNEWETDENKPIKVRDLIALGWIPLNRLSEAGLLPIETESGAKIDFSVSPQNIYRNKGECSKLFDRLMEHPQVSKPKNGPHHELHNPAVGSAFDVLARMPALYDRIYRDLPESYNRNGGKFGRIRAVQKPQRGGHYTHFTHTPCEYRYPDGFIMPLIYGLKALMEVRDGKVVWATDPDAFLDRHFDAIVGAYRLPLEMSYFDPQKLGKNENSHRSALSEFEKALLKDRALQAA
jgi:hypothetical protein